ncbi:hypothetical protein U1Q18_031618 [Sarracenia purpurea var. burkii]
MEEELPLPLGRKTVVDVGAVSEDQDEEVEDDDGDSYLGGEDIEIAPGDENLVVIGTEDGGRRNKRRPQSIRERQNPWLPTLLLPPTTDSGNGATVLYLLLRDASIGTSSIIPGAEPHLRHHPLHVPPGTHWEGK